MHFDLDVVEVLIVQTFLGPDGSSDVVRVEADPDTTFRMALVYLDLQYFAEFCADRLDLFFDVNEVAGVFLQVNFLLVKHVRKHQTVGWMALRE